ncbi:hypothetical protein GCM10018773_14280 [Streptomyces candidus]|nr:hypothetical protein GCM10018773_14280 [Streptomyces candidus]
MSGLRQTANHNLWVATEIQPLDLGFTGLPALRACRGEPGRATRPGGVCGGRPRGYGTRRTVLPSGAPDGPAETVATGAARARREPSHDPRALRASFDPTKEATVMNRIAVRGYRGKTPPTPRLYTHPYE